MTRVKEGDTVVAHLDAGIRGTVVKVLREASSVWSSSGPMTEETFCLVRLKNDKVIKLKVSDVYVDH